MHIMPPLTHPLGFHPIICCLDGTHDYQWIVCWVVPLVQARKLVVMSMSGLQDTSNGWRKPWSWLDNTWNGKLWDEDGP